MNKKKTYIIPMASVIVIDAEELLEKFIGTSGETGKVNGEEDIPIDNGDHTGSGSGGWNGDLEID